MKQSVISENVIQRLPKYYRYLTELTHSQKTRVSSKMIAEALNITASQVRQDLSKFGTFGQEGYGYDVEFLKDRIKDILGLNTFRKLIIIGGGRIGQAIANYTGFIEENAKVVAIFDIETSHINKIDGVDVLHISTLLDYAKQNKIDIAVISVQKDKAKECANLVVQAGIKAIWNFAPVDLGVNDKAVVENINMSESLMRLIYKSRK